MATTTDKRIMPPKTINYSTYSQSLMRGQTMLTPVNGFQQDEYGNPMSGVNNGIAQFAQGSLHYDKNGNMYRYDGPRKGFTLMSAGAGGAAAGTGSTKPKTPTGSASGYTYGSSTGVAGQGSMGGTSLYSSGALPKGMNPHVATIYRELFGRLPTKGQNDSWVKQMKKGMTVEQIKAKLMRSSEFRAQGGMPIGTYNKDMVNKPTMPKGTTFTPVMQSAKSGELLNPNKYNMDPDALNVIASQGQVTNADMPDRFDASTYDAATIEGAEGDAAQQEWDPRYMIEAQFGTLSESTLEALMPPEGTVDPRSTVQYQYEKLTSGDMKWARGAIREAQAMMAQRGIGNSTMAGEAVTSAILREALPIAQQDAKVFETMTLKNLDLKAQATFMKAGFLAEMDMKNLDNRQQAAVLNAQRFFELDMKNLDNRQQMEMLNTQNRQQAMLSNQAAENAARQFNAASQTDVDKFFAELEGQINQFNATQANAMTQFNVNQVNATKQFNAQIANQREQFNKTMAAQIDQSNVQYLRSINTLNTAMKNQAAYVNSQNLLGLHNTAMANQIQLMRDQMAFVWTTSENRLARLENQALMKLQAQIAAQQYGRAREDAEDDAFGGMIGNLLGSAASAAFGSFF
jgi:hypothetical protein